MKKICAAILAMLLVLGVFTACSGAKDEVNPEILGVKDAAAVEQGKEYDALAGVTATDDKDGDLTAKIVITSTPALEFVNGKTTPTKQGTYELVFRQGQGGQRRKCLHDVDGNEIDFRRDLL